jgi:FR47-like protein
MAQPDTLAAQRTLASQLLNASPADAVASYFALEHDPKRTRLTVHTNGTGRALAFVAVCQTGLDLFRPMVVLRGDDSSAVRAALREALQPRRQYLFNALPSARPDLESVATLQGEAVHVIYVLNAADFQPIVNILVQTSKTPDGLWRAAIKARDGTNAAEAGTSWISSRYAEIFVNVVEGARSRGLGKSVVSAVSANVLGTSRLPLYVAEQDNTASIRLAQRLGFHNTNAFELSGALSLKD